MCDRRSADAAFCAHHPDQPAQRLGARRPEKVGDRVQEINDSERRYEILVDAERHELPIENYVVRPAKDDNLRSRVAHVRELA